MTTKQQQSCELNDVLVLNPSIAQNGSILTLTNSFGEYFNEKTYDILYEQGCDCWVGIADCATLPIHWMERLANEGKSVIASNTM